MEDNAAVKSMGKWRLAQFVMVSPAVILCFLVYAARFSSMSALYGATGFFGPGVAGNADEEGGALAPDNQVRSPCSSLRNHTICCDRSDDNADVGFMVGDVRTDAASLSLLLFPPQAPAPGATAEERIRPYTCKWGGNIMGEIQEVRLRVARPEEAAEHWCDVPHDAPVHVVTAAGGYNHNYFHILV